MCSGNPDAAVKAESFSNGDNDDSTLAGTTANGKPTRLEDLHACHEANHKPMILRAGSVVPGPPGVEQAAAAAVAAVEAPTPKATTNIKAGELQNACS